MVHHKRYVTLLLRLFCTGKRQSLLVEMQMLKCYNIPESFTDIMKTNNGGIR